MPASGGGNEIYSLYGYLKAWGKGLPSWPLLGFVCLSILFELECFFHQISSVCWWNIEGHNCFEHNPSQTFMPSHGCSHTLDLGQATLTTHLNNNCAFFLATIVLHCYNNDYAVFFVVAYPHFKALGISLDYHHLRNHVVFKYDLSRTTHITETAWSNLRVT